MRSAGQVQKDGITHSFHVVNTDKYRAESSRLFPHTAKVMIIPTTAIASVMGIFTTLFLAAPKIDHVDLMYFLCIVECGKPVFSGLFPTFFVEEFLNRFMISE